jgi:hypothetical protein
MWEASTILKGWDLTEPTKKQDESALSRRLKLNNSSGNQKPS